jgi:hypothetical protein
MRRLLASMSMVLAVSAAGAASAHDATKVIFDLSELQQHKIVAATPSKNTTNYSLPMGSLPVGAPSGENGFRNGERSIDESDGAMEIGKHGRGTGMPGVGRTPGKGTGRQTPNPEPGTMLLLGTGIVAGTRFLRRKNAR